MRAVGKVTRGGLAALTAALIAGSAAAPASAALPSDPAAAGSAPLSIIHLGEAVDRLARTPVDIPVAVPDTGLDLDHPEFAGRLFSLPAPVLAPCQANYLFANCTTTPTVAAGAPGWDMIGQQSCNGPVEQPDADPTDPVGCSGHGSAVAGALGAAWNNGIGSAGTAPNARFIAMRTCYDTDNCYGHVQPFAFDWVADRGARVISLSWTQGLSPEMQASVARNSNTLFVTIPGGIGMDDIDAMAPGARPYPCSIDLPNVICVTTSGLDDGHPCGPYGRTLVDIATPVENMVVPNNQGGLTGSGCYTSLASPLVAGVATMLFGIVPTATPAQVKDAILSGARPAPAWSGKTVTGGILDARAAVDAFQAKFGLGPAAPDTKKGKGPKKKTTKRKATFKFSTAVPGATFQCSLDDKAYKPCKSPKKLKKVKPGKHTFEAQAVNAGVPDPTPARWKWKVLKG